MRAMVHFSVGLCGGVFLLLLFEFEDRHEFLLMFASGLWALVPDLGWLLLRVGPPGVATLWKAVFNSPLGNLFWFAPLLDAMEPVNRVVEMTSAFVLLTVAVLGHYYLSTWDGDAARRE